MKRRLRYGLLLLLATWPLWGAPVQAETGRHALLDFVTCYGVDLPASAFQPGPQKDPGVIRMEQAMDAVLSGKSAHAAEVEGFYTPDPPAKLLGFPLQFIGFKGFGIFHGVNVTLGGEFHAVKKALQAQQITYDSKCASTPEMHLYVCHQDLNERYARMIMTHPRNPEHQTILICVDKTKLKRRRSEKRR